MKTGPITNRRAFLTAAVLSFACLTTFAQDYRVLHHFAGGVQDGSVPLLGRLIESGSTLYGMTAEGGSNNVGTVFKLNADGTGFQVLHHFVSGKSDGERPYGSLLLSSSILYGMAGGEKTSYSGTIFRLSTQGADYQVLHTFSGREGKWPYDTLILSGSTLYGMCTYGGNNTGSGWVGGGTIFRMSTDGTGFQLLHTFAGGANDGWGPHGSLIQIGSTLYGTTLAEGRNHAGAVFKLGTNGSDFAILHHFGGGTNDGSAPYGTTLLPSGPVFYGVTQNGGSRNKGTVFRIATNGTAFSVLHSLGAGGNDASQPLCGTLVQSGSMLYGMTTLGGIGGTNGTVFQIDTNGTSYQVLHRFDGASGREPYGSLLLSGSTLYGMTSAGGSNNLGVIFALDLAPRLGVSWSDTNVTLFWSTNFPGFALESTDQLAGDWALVPGVTGCSATLPVNPETNQFFRLRK